MRHLNFGSQQQDVIFSIRGRDVNSIYGGSEVYDAGPALIGQGVQIPRPHFNYPPLTQDHNCLLFAGVAYRSQWWDRLGLSLGLQKVDIRGVNQ